MTDKETALALEVKAILAVLPVRDVCKVLKVIREIKEGRRAALFIQNDKAGKGLYLKDFGA